ncbi:DUF4041 domain-containing protein [Nocardia niigatensis]
MADAQAENHRLRAQLASTGGLELAELQRIREDLAAQITSQQAVLDGLRRQIVQTQEEQILQAIGIYDYRHPLSTAVAYRARLEELRGQIKAMARRDGGAIDSAQPWAVNGSDAKGRKMIREYSTLMLRAYNAEADNLIRAMKPYKLANAIDRLDKLAASLNRLGETMLLQIAPAYHQLRITELELTADHLEQVARQKQREREERDQLREEQRAQEEYARQREKFEKQQQHYRNALAALEKAGEADSDGAVELRTKLAQITAAIEEVDQRALNIRAGYVYVISNIGAFGEGVIKIGLTRRLDPLDRIRELNNASVPFRFDVHALFFSDDAVSIETAMHRHFADRRVNRVNHRREFFYATPAQARDQLQQLTGQLLQFDELAEAVEYHQSRTDTAPTAAAS